jgi:death-on-curing protein
MLHAEAIKLFGGAHGIRDRALLESALARPRQFWAYGESVSLPRLAASLAFGIVKNHAFVDGNKRASLLAIRAFLFTNGVRFEPPEVEAVTMIEGLAAGSVDEEALTAWIADNSGPRSTVS